MSSDDPDPSSGAGGAPEDGTHDRFDDPGEEAGDAAGAGDDVEGAPTYCAYTDYSFGADVEDLPATGEGATGVEANVWEQLYGVEDPEMPISVVDLGLIYDVSVESGTATVTMTLTYTGCPARDYLREDVRLAAERADGVESAEVDLVWSPEWNLEMVTEAGKDDLREFGVAI